MELAEKTRTIMDTVGAIEQFSRFVRMARAAGFENILASPTRITLFAPINGAFAELSTDELALLEDDQWRSDTVAYHVIAGSHGLVALMGLAHARTLQGDFLTLYSCDGMTVNGARIIEADILCSNGIIHGIDKVLLPQGVRRR